MGRKSTPCEEAVPEETVGKATEKVDPGSEGRWEAALAGAAWAAQEAAG